MIEKLFINNLRTRILVWGSITLLLTSAFLWLEVTLFNRMIVGPRINGLPLWWAGLMLLNHVLGCAAVLSFTLMFMREPTPKLQKELAENIIYFVVFGTILALIGGPALTPLWMIIGWGGFMLHYDKMKMRLESAGENW